MSDTECQIADILLPSASICVFSQDDDTLKSAQLLKEDWRFARVNVDCIDGNVDDAIAKFKKDGATDLIILQTDDIDDSFTERLGELSNYCDDDTDAIIIGPVNDVYLYRQLIDMGVSDYLVRPVSPEIIKDVISKALIDRLGVSDSRLIAFVGAKGGVGASALAQICSLVASDIMGQKTLLMDAGGGWSPLSIGMGFDPATTIAEVSSAVTSGNEDALDRMFYSVSNKLSVLASGADAMLDPSVNSKNYEAVIDNLMVKSPVVFVDLSSSESAIKKMVLSRAHQIIVISAPTVTSLRFCRSLLKEISEIRGGDTDDVSLVINQVGVCKTNEVSNDDITKALELTPSASIDNNPSLFFKYESEMKEIVNDKDFSPLVTAFLPILGKTISGGDDYNCDENDGNSNMISGLLNKLKPKNK